MSDRFKLRRFAETLIPANLEYGELVFTANAAANSLFAAGRDPNVVIRVAGGMYEHLHRSAIGAVTANSALIVDNNKKLNELTVDLIRINTGIVTGIDNSANNSSIGTNSSNSIPTSNAVVQFVSAYIQTQNFGVSNADFQGNLALKLSTSDFIGNIANYPNTTHLTNNVALKLNITDFQGNIANYPNTSQLASNLALYSNTGNVTGNLALKLNISSFQGNIANYPNTSQLASNLALYSNTGQITGNLALKLNVSDFQGNIANYPNTNQLASNLALYSNTGQLQGNLALKLNVSDFQGNIANYPNTGQLTGNLALKLNVSDFQGNIANYPNTSQLTSNLTLKLNVSDFQGNIANYPNTSQLASNLANYSGRSVTIDSPIVGDKVIMFNTGHAFTLQSIRSVLLGPITPSVTFSIRYGTDVSGSGTEVLVGGITVTSNTTVQSNTTLSNPNVPINNFVWITVGSVSGNVTQLHVSLVT